MALKRQTQQRMQIYETVRESREHPTAETVYIRLKPSLPHLSLGTVYRNLHQMAQDGKLQELPGPVARFDGEVRPHTHFVCEDCGDVLDLELPYSQALDAQGAGSGYVIHRHDLIFYGICPACSGKNKKEIDKLLERGKNDGTEGKQDGGKSLESVCG